MPSSRIRGIVRLLILAVAVGLVSCAPMPASQGDCKGTTKVATQLFFGMGVPGGGTVSERQWRTFVNQHLAARFSEGFTVLEGEGAWLHRESGVAQREASRVVVRLHAGESGDEQAIEAVIDAYKRRFAQESVLRWDSPACVWF